VVVAPRPDGFGDSCGEIEQILEAMNIPAPGIMFFDGPQRRVTVRETERPEQPQSTEITVMVFGATSDDTRASRFFGGAEFRMLTEDWRETLGVKQGVLVNEVAPGSAASQAGLRAGDVITTVGKTPVTSPGAFVQLVATSEAPEVQLTLVRQKDKKTVTLRLTPR
jgi:S1-C subfamily serine protease